MSEQPSPRLIRVPPSSLVPPRLDPAQRAVVDHTKGPLLVVAGPGTGKTTTLVEAVAERVAVGRVDPSRILMLTFGRKAAAELRTRISRRLGGTVREPLARTFHSFAFGLLRREAVLAGLPSPRLLAGPEQDFVVRELLRGDVDLGTIPWPDHLRPALSTRGFVQELRDLLLRAVERGLDSGSLQRLGKQHDRADWVAAGAFLEEYLQVTALAGSAGYDAAEIVRVVADRLAEPSDPLSATCGAFDWVFVDEYQDTDPAQELLLRRLVPPGGNLVVVGDPHQSIYAFRGADVRCIERFCSVFGKGDGSPAPELRLTQVRRCAPAVLEAAAAVADRLPGSRAHRGLVAPAGRGSGTVEVLIAARPSSEAMMVASVLRRAHLADGVPWSRMAVLVRSTRGGLSTLRRALIASGVPVEVAADDVPLAEQPAAAMLLDVMALATGVDVLDAQRVTGLLSGPIGGLDALAVRGLRRELRRAELEAGGARSSTELLTPAVMGEGPPGLAARWQRPLHRVGSVLGAVREVAGGDAEQVLWVAWQATGLAVRWQAQALTGGASGAAADRDLDAVVGLFSSACRFADRFPGADAKAFVDTLRSERIPGDSLAPRSSREDGVRILTAHSAKGLEWDLVVVSGVQEGVWPDLRVRGNLLGSEVLIELLEDAEQQSADPGSIAAFRAGALQRMLAEERRLFYVACTRARDRLVVTAVRSTEASGDLPSRFIDELVLPADGVTLPASLAAAAGWDEGEPATLGMLLRRLAVPKAAALLRAHGMADARLRAAAADLDVLRRPMALPPLVGELRAAVADGEAPLLRREAAAQLLAGLAVAGVPGAALEQWYHLGELTDERPLAEPGEPVWVSPSRVEGFARCPLRWVLDVAGAKNSDATSASLGVLVHELAARTIDPEWRDIDRLVAELDRRLPELVGGGPWFAARERARLERMLRDLLEWMARNPRELVDVERAFEVRVERAVLTGRVDRIERDEQGCGVVVDLKTSKTRVTERKVSDHQQLGIYQLAVEQGAFRDVGIEASGGASLLQLGSKARRESLQPPISQAAEPDWARELLLVTAEGMAGRHFEARRNEHCGTCQVRTSCPLSFDDTEGES